VLTYEHHVAAAAQHRRTASRARGCRVADHREARIAEPSTKAVADAVGLTTGAIFPGHFASMDEPLGAVAERDEPCLRQLPAGNLAPLARLVAFVEARPAVAGRSGFSRWLSDQFALALPDGGSPVARRDPETRDR
jgi:hypothetical protein